MLDTASYVTMTRRLCELAEKICEGRVVSVLEGGYNTTALADCALSHVAALARSQPQDGTVGSHRSPARKGINHATQHSNGTPV